MINIIIINNIIIILLIINIIKKTSIVAQAELEVAKAKLRVAEAQLAKLRAEESEPKKSNPIINWNERDENGWGRYSNLSPWD